MAHRPMIMEMSPWAWAVRVMCLTPKPSFECRRRCFGNNRNTWLLIVVVCCCCFHRLYRLLVCLFCPLWATQQSSKAKGSAEPNQAKKMKKSSPPRVKRSSYSQDPGSFVPTAPSTGKKRFQPNPNMFSSLSLSLSLSPHPHDGPLLMHAGVMTKASVVAMLERGASNADGTFASRSRTTIKARVLSLVYFVLRKGTITARSLGK
jgi:hypothetical protein